MHAPLRIPRPPRARMWAAGLVSIAVAAAAGSLDRGSPAGPAGWRGSPARGVSVSIRPSGMSVRLAAARLSLASADAGRAPWRRTPQGLERTTPFGAERVSVGADHAEESLDVSRRVGLRTWRWRISAPGAAASLTTRGGVSFARPPRVLPLAVQPVRITDRDGRDITPEGLGWSLHRDRRGWWLGLRLDDRRLPAPYTIDPEIVFNAAASGANSSSPGSPASLTISVPAGATAGDLMLAQVAVNGGTNATITPPAGWTLVRRTNNTTSVGEASFRHTAGSAEPGAYTWTIADSSEAPRAAGGIAEYRGIDLADAYDTSSATNSGSSASLTATAVTTAADGELVVGLFATGAGTTFTPPAGMSERSDARNPSSSGPSGELADLTQAAAGSSGSRTATAGTAAAFVTQLIAWNLDVTAPAGALSAPAAGAVRGAAALAASASDAGSGVASATFQVAPAGSGDWATLAVDTSAPYQSVWDTLGVSDGMYDLRVRTVDNAGNSAVSAATPVRVDNTAPVLEVSLAAATPSGAARMQGHTVYYRGAAAGSLRLSASVTDAGSGPAGAGFPVLAGSSAGWVHAGETVSDPANGPYVSTNGFSWAAGTSGAPTESVQAMDAAGNTTGQTISLVNDSDPPTSEVAEPAAGALLRGPAQVSAAAVDAAAGLAGVELQVSPSGGGVWATVGESGSAVWDTTSVPDGRYDVRAVATDVLGNTAPSAIVTVVVDNTAPAATMIAPAAGASVRGAIAVRADVEDALSGVAGSTLQRSPAGAGDWTDIAALTGGQPQAVWDTTATADGPYDLRVVSADAAGNASASPAVRVLVDNTAPAVALSGPHPDQAVRVSVPLAAAAGDAGSGPASATYEVAPAGSGAWATVAVAQDAPYTVSWDTGGLADGRYDLRVVLADRAGNTATDTVTGLLVDNTSPATWLEHPGAALRGQVTLQAHAGDSGSGVASVRFERSPAAAGAWSAIATAAAPPYSAQLDTTQLEEGRIDLRVVTADAAGNQSVHLLPGIRVDNTAPTVAMIDPGRVLRRTAGLRADAADEGSGLSGVSFELAPAGSGAWTAVPASLDTTGLADGRYDLRARAVDAAGNSSASPAVPGVLVDNTVPTVSLAGVGRYQRGHATVGGDADDAGSGLATVRLQLAPAGSGSWTDVGEPRDGFPIDLDTEAMADGEYTLRSVAEDTAGNSAASQPLPVVVDNTAPTLGISAPRDGDRVSGTVSLEAGAADAGSGVAVVRFRMRAAGGEWAAAEAAGWDTTSVPDGQAELEAVAADRAGNSAVATLWVTVDNQPPTVQLASVPALVRGRLDLQASCSDDARQVEFQARRTDGQWMSLGMTPATAARLAVDTGWMADGGYDVRAVATDAGGHTATSDPRRLVVDNTAPTGWLTASAATAAPGDVISLTASAVDPTSGVAAVSFLGRPLGGAFAPLASVTAAPYAARWDTAGLPPGGYELAAAVTDSAGNTSITPPVGVTLAVSGPPAPAPFTFTAGRVSTLLRGQLATLRLTVTASAAASVRAALTRGPKVVRTWRMALAPAARTLTMTLPRRLLPAGSYRLALTAAGPGGQVVKRTITVRC